MKLIKILIVLMILVLGSCVESDGVGSNGIDSVSSQSNTSKTEWKCGQHNGKQLWTGPRGGCYYKNSNGNKTYVNRSECSCL